MFEDTRFGNQVTKELVNAHEWESAWRGFMWGLIIAFVLILSMVILNEKDQLEYKSSVWIMFSIALVGVMGAFYKSYMPLTLIKPKDNLFLPSSLLPVHANRYYRWRRF